jgi:hypothetical protein
LQEAGGGASGADDYFSMLIEVPSNGVKPGHVAKIIGPRGRARALFPLNQQYVLLSHGALTKHILNVARSIR